MSAVPVSLPCSSLRLPALPSACTTARRWVAQELQDTDARSADLLDDVALIVSELVSNAVQHGAAPIVVELSRAATTLDLSVTDAGEPPYLLDSAPLDPTATRGRGLAIVAALATAWGVRALRPGPGKTVWCRL